MRRRNARQRCDALDVVVSQAARRGNCFLATKGLAMQRFSRLTLAALVTLALAACATTPPPDLTPPPSKRLDAKTTLENRR